ncbi:TonB-dependent receptor plug domain-containing protein [Pseudogemmobacter humi]|uniref:Vitamin B12 transporter BtuB n=1 Tax=Pseudogemmobacter humi TaxID=2483812 RepID=A0A3P5XGQ6_9RHOB|nr:TonB-dependent receptor [Pseudogemmobacter humi]VDC30096.1 Vitamin B12 transporter BtuB precursor [Pseudogemmobacter humi]
MRSSSLSVLALSLVLPSVSLAQESVDLGTIWLQGGFSPIEQARYGRAFSVITADEIEARGITSVQDALRAIPGVAVNGSGRSFTQIRIRGGEGNHTLILVDGVPAAGGADEYGLSGFDAADIERIEVLRGPQSVYFGSNASSGVINIITKRAAGPGYGGKLEAGNGHFANAWFSVGNERGGVRLSWTDSKDKGVDESGDDGERDFIDRQTLRLNGNWQASEQLSFTLGLTGIREHYAYDATPWTATSAAGYVQDDPNLFAWKREQVFSLGARFEGADGRVVHELNLSQTVNKSRRAQTAPWGKGTTEVLRYRAMIGLDGQATTADHLLNVLVERREDDHSSAPAYQRDRTSAALEYRGTLENGLSLQAGLRYDDNTMFEDFTGWNLAASYPVHDQVRLHGSIGRASVDPSYGELFSDSIYVLGNPGLKPEENRGIDLGVEFTSADGRGRVDVTAFYEVLYDEITYAAGISPPLLPGGAPRGGYYNQDGKSRRKGVEVSGTWEASEQLSFGVNYTWLRATNPDGSVEVRRPKHELAVQATWRTRDDRFSVTGDIRRVAGNYDDQWWTGGSTGQKLPDYTVVNLSARYRLTDQVDLTARVLNVFDENYSDVWGYRAQDRAVWLGVKANF